MTTKQISTINVIDCNNSENFQIDELVSYEDTPENNQVAEALFRQWCRASKDDVTDEELDIAVENGVMEIGEGCIALVHST